MPAQRKYPEELRERAVKMVLEIQAREGRGGGEVARVAGQLGIHRETLRLWVRQAQVDDGSRPGTWMSAKRCPRPTGRRGRSSARPHRRPGWTGCHQARSWRSAGRPRHSQHRMTGAWSRLCVAVLSSA
ncbi:MAG TPA: hypothetical protein DHU96_30100 [Actinobacteria bacterium]|nr:hypothetical protein [Actinomycetota bacterium]